MKIQLVKIYELYGKVKYATLLDGEVAPESETEDVFDAQEIYERIKLVNSVNRTVVLLEEEI